MAPLSALSSVVMFGTMNRLGLSVGVSLWMAFLYALGTPVFFRTAYLNQNLMVGIFTFIGFILLWQFENKRQSEFWKRFTAAGLLGGLAVLCDYSGLVPLVMLYFYGVLRRIDAVRLQVALKESLWYFGGAIIPLGLLWIYQWGSFGHPLYPGQHYMPPVEWIDVGYQGAGWPSFELLGMLLFDSRFGLFTVSPILLLGLFSLLLDFRGRSIVPLRETLFCLAVFLGMTVFLSSVQYTRLQWVTGIRYIVPVIPFLFLPTAAVLIRLPRVVAYGLSALAFGASWAMSMARRGVGVLDESMLASVVSVITEGLQFPWLTTISRMEISYVPFLSGLKIWAWLLLGLVILVIYGIWRCGCLSKEVKNAAS
jgi:hypothetical protein